MEHSQLPQMQHHPGYLERRFRILHDHASGHGRSSNLNVRWIGSEAGGVGLWPSPPPLRSVALNLFPTMLAHMPCICILLLANRRSVPYLSGIETPCLVCFSIRIKVGSGRSVMEKQSGAYTPALIERRGTAEYVHQEVKKDISSAEGIPLGFIYGMESVFRRVLDRYV